MRYVVLGCGAIGGAVAAGLARDGHDVLVSDPDPAVVAAVSSRGLRIEGPAESFTVAVPAVAPADLPPRLDGPVLVAVRARDMAGAAAHLAGRLDGAGYLACLRHGLDAGILAGEVGPGRVVAARADLDAAELEPGTVRRGNRTALLVGELDDRRTERVRLLASHIAGALSPPGGRPPQTPPLFSGGTHPPGPPLGGATRPRYPPGRGCPPPHTPRGPPRSR